jgi:hypothetical protein
MRKRLERPGLSTLSVELICFRFPWVTQHILAGRVPNGHELEEGFTIVVIGSDNLRRDTGRPWSVSEVGTRCREVP